MLAAASGVPAVGRIWIFCQVRVLAEPLPLLTLVMVAVIVEPSAATTAGNVAFTAKWLMLLAAVPLPAVIFTVIVAPLLKIKPLGLVKMMVPAPICPAALSKAIGPVRVVH